MPKKSMSQVYGEGRHHKRGKSGQISPSASPKTTAAAHIKRNSSHVVLPKNRSAGNLRKNQSATTLTALNRNLSRGGLNKLGAPAEQKEQKAKQEQQQKQGVFDLGNASSEEEEEAEWEDSTASPELTRNNSKVSTPARSHTPNGEPVPKPPEQQAEVEVPEKTSSPPEPSIKNNRSAPNLRYERSFSQDQPRQNPALLQLNGRSRAPPAMTTATARSSQLNLNRSDSQRSLLKSSRTSLETSEDSAKTGNAPRTPATPGLTTESSGSAGVSHFLTNHESSQRTSRERNGSDTDESVSDFMATYKPQPSESPEKPRTNINRARLATQPSRTQQKLELQRREVMRGGGPPPTSSGGMALSVGSSVSIHSRSASKGRNRSMAGEYKAIKADYENAVKQLTVVRRFRNPILESLNRLKQNGGVLSAEASATTVPGKADQKRPPSRHGRMAPTGPAASTTNIAERDHATNGGEHAKSVAFKPTTHRDSRVSFQLSRQGSHDDILTTSAGSPDAHHDDLDDGLSPKEALIRRMWESRIHVA
ncbi:hypothetical protein PMZ80_000335 [Knufia obscura]|uniref:Uncharacterized protein n=1 Tax=Knufia obscura TaxID=1635080 RepID=A0ABR0S1K0_9EURO|nr:hypothetical protein PMZ80_000335 [Knufia obscura]